MAALAALAPAGASAAEPAWGAPKPFYMPGGNSDFESTFASDGSVHVASNGGVTGSGLWYARAGHYERFLVNSILSADAVIAVRGTGSSADVRIAWSDTEPASGEAALWLSRNDTGVWVSSRIFIGRVTPVGIVNLSDRRVGIVFTDRHDRLRYITWHPVNGPSTPVTIADRCCTGSVSMVIRGGKPVVAYSETRSSGYGGPLRVVELSGSTWKNRMVDSATTYGASAAFDSAGRLLIAYDRSASIRLARRVGSSWSSRQVLGEDWYGPSLATDASGRIAVAAGRTEVEPGYGTKRMAYLRLDRPSDLVKMDIVRSDGWYGHLGFKSGKAVVVFGVWCACAGGGPDARVWTIRQK